MSKEKPRFDAAFSVLLIALVLTAAVLGYSVSWFTGASTVTVGGTRPELKVLTTLFPLQDWAQKIGGVRANVTLLVPSGADVHGFEPTAASIHAIAAANVLILNGAGLEPWAPVAIASAGNPNLVVVNCSDGISLIKVQPQFQAGGRVVDPHTWLDPVDASAMVQNILKGFLKADPASSTYFRLNALAYQVRLEALDAEFLNLTGSHTATRSFLAFPAAFSYLAQRYNLTQIPASGPFEQVPTTFDISYMVALTNQNRLCYVGFDPLRNTPMFSEIPSQTRAVLVPMDSIEGLTPEQQVQGQTYLTLMSQTLLALSLSLNHVGC